MKKYIFVGIIILVLATTGVFLWLKNKHAPSIDTINTASNGPFGTSGTINSSSTGDITGGIIGTGNGNREVGGSTGGALSAEVIENIKKISNMYGEGNYEVSNTDNYVLSYDDLDHSFNLAIYKRPVGYSRKLGEEKLIEVLGISKEQICKLNIFVGAPADVDPDGPYGYGLSFCPGSVVLPEMER